MQIILLEKITNLGQLGDVVKVRDGFARNYLIPHGKAKRATAENLKVFESRRAELERMQAESLAQAQERALQDSNVATMKYIDPEITRKNSFSISGVLLFRFNIIRKNIHKLNNKAKG